MTAEGTFPKSDGDILYASEANDFKAKSNLASVLPLGNLQKIATNDNDFENFDMFGGENLLVDGFAIKDTQDRTRSTCVVDNEEMFAPTSARKNSKCIFNCHTFDNFNDSSLNTNIWTSSGAGATEDTEKMILTSSSTAYITSDGPIGGIDFKTFDGDSEFVTHIANTAIGNTHDVELQICSAGSAVAIVDLDTTVAHSHTYRVKIEKSASKAYVAIDNGSYGPAINISGALWNIRYYVHDTGNPGDPLLYAYFLGYVGSNAGSEIYTSSHKNFKNNKNYSAMTWDYTGSEAEITGYMSANSGVNYNVVTKDTWTAIGTTGSIGKIKLVMSGPSVINGSGTHFTNINSIKVAGGYYSI